MKRRLLQLVPRKWIDVEATNYAKLLAVTGNK
jgi:hypothetical protein